MIPSSCSERDFLRIVETYGRTGYWHVNFDPESIFFSKEACIAHGMPPGYRPESVQECIEWYHPDDQAKVVQVFEQAKAGGKKIFYQARLLNAQKEVRWIEVCGEVGFNGAGEAESVVGTLTDVSADREVSTRLSEALLSAQSADRLKDSFLANMSHELRTPLNAIIGFSQVIKMMQEQGKADEKVGEYATDIANAGGHLLSIIEDIFSVAQMEAVVEDCSSNCAEVGALLDDVQALTSVAAREQNRQITFEARHCASACLVSDKEKTTRVLVNLVSNAMKFSPSSAPVRVVAELEKGARVLIRVIDEGPGIPKALHNKIFERFERLEASKYAIEGIGVGLAIARDLVISMGGEIGVDSVEGEGSTFWLNFPVETRSEQKIGALAV